MSRVWHRACFLLLTLCSYVIVFICLDEYMFESSVILETRLKTQLALNADESTKNMFSLDRDLLKTRNSTHGNKSETGRKRLILMWEPAFGVVVPDPNACPGCVLTYDQEAISDADAVIFHFAETRNSVEWLPWRQRNPLQRWVWLCLEPPWNVRHVFQKTLTGLNGVFNWTMTYRVDSDVLASYENMHTVRRSVKELMQRKKNSLMAAWVVSNCHSPPRERFYKEISRYIQVDVFGRCGEKMLCSDNCQYDALSSAYDSRNLCRDDCQHDTLSRYKFYFSLENSQCRDYISEKFWVMGLESGAVPVVMGPPRGDYELVAPPNSFIHVDDFPTVKELADYLIALSNNETLYESYLKWTEDKNWRSRLPKSEATALKESRENGNVNGLCALCQKLHRTPRDSVKIVNDLDQWWFGEGYSPKGDSLSICKSGSTASGFPLRWAVTLGYTAFFLFVVAVCAFVLRKRLAVGAIPYSPL